MLHLVGHYQITAVVLGAIQRFICFFDDDFDVSSVFRIAGDSDADGGAQIRSARSILLKFNMMRYGFEWEEARVVPGVSKPRDNVITAARLLSDVFFTIRRHAERPQCV